MNRSEFIQKKLAFFLLLVFALSTAPKVFFHDVLAHHKDGLICKHSGKQTPCFHQQSFHCAFDDLVVTAPYLSTEKETLAVARNFLKKPTPSFSSFLFSSPVFGADSRGPPAI